MEHLHTREDFSGPARAVSCRVPFDGARALLCEAGLAAPVLDFLQQTGLTVADLAANAGTLDARKVLQSGSSYETTLSGTAAGQERWVAMTLAPAGGADGASGYLHLEDVTAAATADLADDGQATGGQGAGLGFDDLAMALGAGVVLMQRRGPFGRLNRAARDLLGISSIAEARNCLSMHVEDLHAAPGVAVVDHPGADGMTRKLALSISPVAAQGQDNVLILITDLTDALAQDSDHLAEINHEMRTPLTSLLGSLGILANALEGQDATTTRMLDMARRNAGKLMALVEDLAVTGADLPLRPEIVDPVAALNEAVGANAMLAARHGVTFCVETKNSAGSIQVDPARLQQILTNLISNAAKYSGDSRRVDLGVESRDGNVSFVVRDHGLGIPQAALPHIFDRFYRVQEPAHLSVGGTGLGLAITRDLVTRQGGDITVASPTGPGAGTEFRVSFPGAMSATALG